jgi:hypothetical protein
MDITHTLYTIKGYGDYAVTQSEAWSSIACPSCRNPNMLIVAIRDNDTLPALDYATSAWLLCVSCGSGAVTDRFSRVSPSAKEYPTPDGTPEAETKTWEEVRNCLAVGAYNATAMLCRKLLLHLVFTHERSLDPHATPRNITFAQAVQYLLDNGVITTANELIAREIKNIGNRANHELPDVSGQDAQKIALFTHYLFVSIYEMPKKASIPTPFVGAAAEPYEGDLEPEATEAESVSE